MTSRTGGFVLALISGFLWGTVDIAAQYLTHNCHMSAAGFVSSTLALTSFLLLGWEVITKRTKAFTPLWCNKRNLRDELLFALFLLFSQVLYYWCVSLASSATAAVLGATRPFWIMGVCVIFLKGKATWTQLLCAFLAIFGVGLMVTQGSLTNISFSWLALVVGLGAALTGGLYTIQDKRVITDMGVGLASAWALTFVAVAVNCYQPFWSIPIQWDWMAYFCVAWVAIVGNIFAYLTYFISADKIPPAVTGLLETVEPLTTTTLSFLLLGMVFSGWSLAGGALILLSVALLSLHKK